MFRLRKNHPDSARNMIKELPAEAIRYAHEQGYDLWPVWLNRHDSPIKWEQAKAGATVGCALSMVSKSITKVLKK